MRFSGIRRLTHVRFEQKGTKGAKGKRRWQLLAKSQLLSGFAFESQAAIGTKGQTKVTIAGEVLTFSSSFPSFASVQCLPFLKGVAHAVAFGV